MYFCTYIHKVYIQCHVHVHCTLYTVPVTSHRQGLGTLQRTLHRIDKDLKGKIASVALDKECMEVHVRTCILYLTCKVMFYTCIV